MLEIKNLQANINGKEIMKGINLTVKTGIEYIEQCIGRSSSL